MNCVQIQEFNCLVGLRVGRSFSFEMKGHWLLQFSLLRLSCLENYRRFWTRWVFNNRAGGSGARGRTDGFGMGASGRIYGLEKGVGRVEGDG